MKTSHRRRSRELAAQAIYSWQLTGNKIADVEEAMLEENDVKSFDVNFFRKLINGVETNIEAIDQAYRPHLARDMEELDNVEKSILRVACYELCECPDVPYRVVINEAIEVAKIFGADDSHKFVNGVLDKAVKFVRKDEIN